MFIMLLALAQTTEATEQVELVPPQARQGFYLGLGLRSGLMGVHTDEVGSLGLFYQGGTFNFRFGQMATDLLGFGMSIELGGGSSKEWGVGYGALSAEVQLAPFDVIDIAFRASIGVGAAGVARKDEELKQDDDPTGAYGSFYTLGVSYDWFPFFDKGDTGGFSVTSFIEGRLLPTGDLIAGGVFAGVELSYFFGYGKNRLELDVEKAYRK
jgi:hypothetical protein